MPNPYEEALSAIESQRNSERQEQEAARKARDVKAAGELETRMRLVSDIIEPEFSMLAEALKKKFPSVRVIDSSLRDASTGKPTAPGLKLLLSGNPNSDYGGKPDEPRSIECIADPRNSNLHFRFALIGTGPGRKTAEEHVPIETVTQETVRNVLVAKLGAI